LQSIRKGAQVVIATPGRLYDFLSRNLVALGNVRILVLDEADRMLDMGFLPTIKRIMATIPAERQTLFFSATIESSVKHLVETHVRNAVRVEVGSTTKPVERSTCISMKSSRTASWVCCNDAARRAGFVPGLRPHQARRGPAGEEALADGAKTATIHGNRSQNQRTQALRAFRTATIASWWRPTSRRAAFTWKASRTW
jgi:ATP-dependent RNA helicase RhlE